MNAEEYHQIAKDYPNWELPNWQSLVEARKETLRCASVENFVACYSAIVLSGRGWSDGEPFGPKMRFAIASNKATRIYEGDWPIPIYSTETVKPTNRKDS